MIDCHLSLFFIDNNIPKISRGDIVLIHSSTLKECSIPIGGAVILESVHKKVTVRTRECPNEHLGFKTEITLKPSSLKSQLRYF